MDEDVPITDVIAAIERITPNSILMVDACECGLHEDGVMLPANYDDLKGASLVHPAPELQRFESSGTIRVVGIPLEVFCLQPEPVLHACIDAHYNARSLTTLMVKLGQCCRENPSEQQ